MSGDHRVREVPRLRLESPRQKMSGDHHMDSRSSVLESQLSIVSELSLSTRTFGLVVAFLAIVGLWESADQLVARFARRDLVLSYFILMLSGILAVVLSTWFLRRNLMDLERGFLAQSLLVLSTLVLACGSWGWIGACIDRYVSEDSQQWMYIIGGAVFFLSSFCYSLYTKHFALLDIASCVTSLGLLDVPEAEEDKPLSPAELASFYGAGGVGRRASITCQGQIVRRLSFPSKMAGLTIAFLSVVGLWEGIDRSVDRYASRRPVLAYAIIFCLGLALVVHSTLRIRAKLSHLEPTHLAQSYLGLSTIVLAAGTWGCITTPVERHVPEDSQPWAYVLGGSVCFSASLVYSVYTRHFALLDVVSCVTSLGLRDDSDSDDDPFSPKVSTSPSSRGWRRQTSRRLDDSLTYSSTRSRSHSPR